MHTAIEWFAKNSVAANLVMWGLLITGGIALFQVNQEEFPSIDVQVVSISVPYLGAAPEEVEQGVCIRIEEAIEGTDGVDKVTSTASESNCTVMVELNLDADEIAVVNEVKSKVDGINTFPIETEKPIVSKLSLPRPVVQIAISGTEDERVLKELGREVREDIVALEGISQVKLRYTRPYEISIDVSEQALRRYGLTIEEVTRAVRSASLDMPGGSIKTAGGEILIRTQGQAYRAQEFANVIVRTSNDGTRLRLGEISNVRDDFEEGDLYARFNGSPAVVVEVLQIGSEDLIAMAETVRDYVGEKRVQLPQGVKLDVWVDTSEDLQDRLDVLLNTAIGGLLLVMVVLALFLHLRLALWVSAGIPIALLGTIALFPWVGVTISTMTVMAFILVLGILVDDAIVVGERIYSHEQMGKTPVQAAIDGTWEVSVPVIFGVLTTVAAFLPLILVEGRMSDFFSVIGIVVIIALGFSIVESQLILPSHLAHRGRKPATRGPAKMWSDLQQRLSKWLENFANNVYLPAVSKAVRYRYATAGAALGIFILAVALLASGRVIFGFFPAIEGNRIYASLEMPEGVAAQVTIQGTAQIEQAAETLARELEEEFGNPVVRNRLTSIGTGVYRGGPAMPQGPAKSHFAEVVIELEDLATRGDRGSNEIANRWRELVGNIPDAVKLSFDSASFDAGNPIEYELSGRDTEQLSLAAAELRAELSRYDGVFDISDSFRSGKQEVKLSLLPEARNLGLTLNDLASQVRNSFYGSEAQRVQRGEDDVRVMVRFPENERRSIGNLEDMYIRTPDGSEVPFYSVARFEIGRGYSSIQRLDGRRVIRVIADVDRGTISPEEVNGSLQADVLPILQEKYPALSIGIAGEMKERIKAMGGLVLGAMLSLLLIYGLLAIPLKSYWQPVVIMSVIPFGAVGAIVGHFIMDVQLMFFSALGIVALSGVGVNSSLVLVDYINRQRADGVPMMDAVLTGCVVRFRPIVLTSVTTFVGLIPLMAYTSPTTAPFQPMAVALAYGVLFATFTTMSLVPALYVIQEDLLGWVAKAQVAIFGEETENPEQI